MTSHPYQLGWTPSEQSLPPFSTPPVTTSGLDPSNQRLSPVFNSQATKGGWDQPSQVPPPLSTQ